MQRFVKNIFRICIPFSCLTGWQNERIRFTTYLQIFVAIDIFVMTYV